MNALDQYRLLKRIEHELTMAMACASSLLGAGPLIRKLREARDLAEAWRCDQEAELPPEEEFA